MNTALPDNAINAELYSRLNNLDVNGTDFKCYVGRVSDNAANYFLISTQLNQTNSNKCGDGWINSTEIQVVTRQDKRLGSKTLLNQAVEELRQEVQDLSITGFKLSEIQFNVVNELIEETGSEIFYRKITRLESTIR